MRIRLLLAVVWIAALPMWFSPSTGNKLTKSAPFAMVALAGHTIYGGWCDCGSPGCICDPGEVGGQTYKPVSDQTRKPSDQGAFPIRARSGFDFGTGALMIAFALFVWTRLRA